MGTSLVRGPDCQLVVAMTCDADVCGLIPTTRLKRVFEWGTNKPPGRHQIQNAEGPVLDPCAKQFISEGTQKWPLLGSKFCRRPDGSVGMALVLPALTDCRWWFESLLVHSGVSSATRRKATGADHKKNLRIEILSDVLKLCKLLCAQNVKLEATLTQTASVAGILNCSRPWLPTRSCYDV